MRIIYLWSGPVKWRSTQVALPWELVSLHTQTLPIEKHWTTVYMWDWVNNYKFLPHKRTKSSKLQHETPSYDIIKWFQLPKEAFYLWKWLIKNVLFTQIQLIQLNDPTHCKLNWLWDWAFVLKTLSHIFIAVFTLPNECY